jgi:small subunit ribosomal protein S20
MPITTSAKKALRVAKRKRVFNLRRKDALDTSVKAFKKAVASGDKAAAAKLLPAAYQAIDKATKRGLIKKNTAARKKSNVAKLLAK